jgi:4-aminobutyrate aminotransferase-like enzyme
MSDLSRQGVRTNSATAKWVQRDDAAILGWRHFPRVVFEQGNGVRLRDVEGREYLDFISGHISLLLGHNHPEVRAALIEQSAKIWHHYKYFAATPVIEFAEMLQSALPPGLDAINFAAVGSEANEIALRIARGATRAFDIVSVIGGLYGGTLAVEGLNSIGGARKKNLGPLLAPARTSTIVTPYCYRCPLGLKYPSCDIQCVDASEELTKQVGTGDVAAIITETILGAGGMIVPPPEWLPRLKAMAERLGALLILDEVQVAPFKTGRTWCFEHYGVVPDVMTLGKAIGGGMAIAATVTRRDLAERAKETEVGVPWAGTFAGEPLAAAVAVKSFEILLKGKYLDRAAELGDYLMGRLRNVQDRYEIIGDVRGKGMYIGVEVVRDGISRERDNTMMHRVRWNALEEGLLLAGSSNVLKMFPALVITRAEIDEGVDKLERAIKRSLAGEPRGIDQFTITSVT